MIIFPSIYSEVHIIECVVKEDDTAGDLNFGPSCSVSNSLTLKENEEISFQNQTKPEKFELLRFIEKNFPTIPRRIDIYIPNLKALVVFKSNLTKITSEDLKNLKDLEFLNLNYNLIEVLENYLFKFNPKLSTILMKSNRIKFVHPTAFHGLNNVQTLDLQNNHCFNGNTEKNQSKSLKLITEINLKCWTEPMEILKNMSYLEMEVSKMIIVNINDTLHQKLTNMNNHLNDLQSQISHQNYDNFFDFFKSLIERNWKLMEVITVINSGILVIIIPLILILICKRKPKDQPSKVKSIKIDHVTHEESGSVTIQKHNEIPINPIYDDTDDAIEEELYSDIPNQNLNKEEQDVSLNIDDSPIYAQIYKTEN